VALEKKDHGGCSRITDPVERGERKKGEGLNPVGLLYNCKLIRLAKNSTASGSGRSVKKKLEAKRQLREK